MEMERIFVKIASEVSPSPAELKEEKKFAAKIIFDLEKFLPKAAKVTFVGSAARDTGLRGDRDIDLFVAFPRDMNEEAIVKKTFDAAKKAVKTKWETHYAEHPYLQSNVAGFQIEVIPCFKVEPNTGIKSAVDRSPLHMDYLQKKLTQRQRRDVRVLKKLLKTNQIYGAEVEIGGFSGLVCEQLMLKYGDLENLLREASVWLPPTIVDYEGTWNSETKQGKVELLHRFKDAPIILIDVIDRNRNAAAAISSQSLAKFILLAKAFVKKPSENFFKEKSQLASQSKAKMLNKTIAKRSTAFLLIELKKPDVVDDILFPQFKRTEKNICKQLEAVGFHLFGSCDSYSTGQLLFEVKSSELPKVKQLVGPPAWHSENVAGFLKGKKISRGPYLNGEKVCIDVEQKEVELVKITKHLLKMEKTGIASHFIESAKKAKVSLVKKVSKTNLNVLVKYLLVKEEWI